MTTTAHTRYVTSTGRGREYGTCDHCGRGLWRNVEADAPVSPWLHMTDTAECWSGATGKARQAEIEQEAATMRRMRLAGSHVDGSATHPECTCGLCRRAHVQSTDDTAPMLTRGVRARHTQEESLF